MRSKGSKMWGWRACDKVEAFGWLRKLVFVSDKVSGCKQVVKDDAVIFILTYGNILTYICMCVYD